MTRYLVAKIREHRMSMVAYIKKKNISLKVLKKARTASWYWKAELKIFPNQKIRAVSI